MIGYFFKNATLGTSLHFTIDGDNDIRVGVEGEFDFYLTGEDAKELGNLLLTLASQVDLKQSA